MGVLDVLEPTATNFGETQLVLELEPASVIEASELWGRSFGQERDELSLDELQALASDVRSALPMRG